MSIAQSRAAFLDKGGTIVEDAPYNVDPDRMRLMPGVAVGRRQPQTAGFLHPHRSVPAYAVECGCRKPAPGLLIPAPAALDIDLARSWFIGDILNDGEAGRRAGCRTVLLDNGHERSACSRRNAVRTSSNAISIRRRG